MTQLLRLASALAAMAIGGQVAAQVTFYEREDYKGKSFTTTGAVVNFARYGFNDRASSAVVQGDRWDRWEVCEDRRFGGRCVVLRPGQYSTLAAMGLNDRISSVRAIGRDGPGGPPLPPPPAPATDSRVVFFENEGFQGRSFTTEAEVEDFRRGGFNDRASSAVVTGGRWEACRDMRFAGPCVVLRPGQYPSLSAMGMNDSITSVRAVGRGANVEDRRYAPLPMVQRDYGRRNDERLYEASITSVRAVVEDSGQRCWLEPSQVVQERDANPNVPGALLGAVIGGILGHQVGGGSGKDVATGIGVLAGAAIGANSGGSDSGQRVVTTQNVQRCDRNPGQAHAAYWDVTYSFRGQDYKVQMNKPPGQTITVNAQGEPRA